MVEIQLVLLDAISNKTIITKSLIDLLAAIHQTGSITSAARAVGLSYKHAWDMLDAANRMFMSKLTSTEVGGPTGGGTTLTNFGSDVVNAYEAASKAACDSTKEYQSFIDNNRKDT